MAIQNWSENITVVELRDDPQFSEDLTALMDALEGKPNDVVLNFATVGFINSSNIASVLRLRKAMNSASRRMVLCGVNAQVLGVLRVTGLDTIFEFTDDISTALATLQLGDIGNS